MGSLRQISMTYEVPCFLHAWDVVAFDLAGLRLASFLSEMLRLLVFLGLVALRPSRLAFLSFIVGSSPTSFALQA